MAIVYTTKDKTAPTKMTATTLKLFNSVVAGEGGGMPFVSDEGVIVMPEATHVAAEIVGYYNAQKLAGNQLNKTFYKSWAFVQNSDNILELWLDQVMHYASTYGTNFEGDTYIPNDITDEDIPEGGNYFKVVKGISKEEMTAKALGLLESGFALTQETIEDALLILDELGYVFTSVDNIKNKEAMAIIATKMNIVPEKVQDIIKMMVYNSTGSTLVVKNQQTLDAIKESDYSPAYIFEKVSVEKFAPYFNQFKPIFLAYKGKGHMKSIINKMAKLSKKLHQPMPQNALNTATTKFIGFEDEHWLENATTAALLKAAGALLSKLKGQDTFLYQIKNGKAWAQKKENKTSMAVLANNYAKVIKALEAKIDFKGKKFYIPFGVTYGLPTSEKQMIGNLPYGTKFTGKNLVVGIYWENAWGAKDLDLSAIGLDGSKVGWNSSYNSKGLTYSGDITSAPNGAVEYLYSKGEAMEPHLLYNSVYSGNPNGAGYKLIIATGDAVTQDYMMNPKNILFEAENTAKGYQNLIGLMKQVGNEQEFVMLDAVNGNTKVSYGENSELMAEATVQTWDYKMTFNQLIEMMGGHIVSDKLEADVDLSINNLQKDTFVNLIQPAE